MSPAFDCFLLFALLNGMILGHDADRRHPCPDDHAALAGVVSRLRAHPPARLRKPCHLLAAAAELAARRLHQLLLDRDRNANSTGGRHSRRSGARALGARRRPRRFVRRSPAPDVKVVTGRRVR